MAIPALPTPLKWTPFRFHQSLFHPFCSVGNVHVLKFQNLHNHVYVHLDASKLLGGLLVGCWGFYLYDSGHDAEAFLEVVGQEVGKVGLSARLALGQPLLPYLNRQ